MRRLLVAVMVAYGLGALIAGLVDPPAPGGAFGVAVAEAVLPGAPALPVTLWSPRGAAGPRPVILYLPGWGGGRRDNAVLAAELASQGFVVAAIDDALANGPMDFSSDTARAETLRRIERKLEAGTAAASRVLDALAAGLAPLPAGLADVTRAGVLGFSFGGATAAEASLRDPRFLAVVNMDGWVFGGAALHGVRRPYLLLSDDTPAPGAAQLGSADPAIRVPAEVDALDLRQQSAHMAAYGGTKVTLLGATHASFTDPSPRARLRRLLAPRRLDGLTAQRMIGGLCAAFFRQALLHQRAALPTYPSSRTDWSFPSPDRDWTLEPPPVHSTRARLK